MPYVDGPYLILCWHHNKRTGYARVQVYWADDEREWVQWVQDRLNATHEETDEWEWVYTPVEVVL